MTKIHISKDGSPNPCQAAIKCRLGRHFSNEQEAQEYADYLNENSEYIQKRIAEHSRNIQNHLNSLEEKSNKDEYKEIVDFIKTTLPNCRDYSESKALVNLVKYANKNDPSKSFNKYQETVAMFNGEKPFPKLQTQEENKRPNISQRRKLERKIDLPVIQESVSKPTKKTLPAHLMSSEEIKENEELKKTITKTLDEAVENSDYNAYVKANRLNEITNQLPNLENEVLHTRKNLFDSKIEADKDGYRDHDEIFNIEMAGIELKNKETELENLKIEQDILKAELSPKKEEEPQPEPEQPKGFFARLFGRR